MATFGVHSEVGKLRKVIVHRPDLSLKRLTPDNHDELLFDDVLWVERAQWEHDQFVARMRERGVEVLYVQDLLAEALAASDDARRRLIELVASERVVGPSLVEAVGSSLSGLAPDALARHLIGGLTVAESGPRPRPAQEHVAHRRGHRRRLDVRPAAAAELAVHARLVVLDLRRRLDQPDVLAGPPPRGLQHGRDLPRPPDVPATQAFEYWYPPLGDDDRFKARGLRPRVARGRRRRDHRQRHGRDRHVRADDRAG